MSFIPGDILCYRNKFVKYRLEITPLGKLQLRHMYHGGIYSVPNEIETRMVKTGHDTRYRVPIENIRRYMGKVPSDRASPEMREFINRRMEGYNEVIDTSGFDALKAAEDAGNIDQEKLCEFCRDYYEMPKSYLCEGCKCEDAYERYIEDNPINKENKMNILINGLVAKVTDNIKDAQLVTQYFGHELNEASIKDEYFVRDNYEDLLNEARAREEKRLANSEKSCA